MDPQERGLAPATSSLRVDTSSKSKPKASRHVADSWEDEEIDETSTDDRDPSTETSEVNSPSGLSRQSTNFNPHPPPPTPASPTAHNLSYSSLEQSSSRPSSSRRVQDTVGSSSAPERRPDKTTATASRLIAAGLGMRAPKRTEEEREYDRTMRDNARKAREKEREEERKREAEEQRAKAAVWED